MIGGHDAYQSVLRTVLRSRSYQGKPKRSQGIIMPFLKPTGAQIADVIKIAKSSEDISSLEEQVRRNGARQLWLMIPTLVVSTAALVGFLLVLFSSEPSALELYLVS